MKNRRYVIPFEMTKSLRFALRFKEESHLLGLQRRSSKPGFWEGGGWGRPGQKRSGMSLLHLSPELLIQQGSSRRSQAICCDGSAFLVKCQMEIEPVLFSQRIQLSNP